MKITIEKVSGSEVWIGRIQDRAGVSMVDGKVACNFDGARAYAEPIEASSFVEGFFAAFGVEVEWGEG
jgi:hypothetical protein